MVACVALPNNQEADLNSPIKIMGNTTPRGMEEIIGLVAEKYRVRRSMN